VSGAALETEVQRGWLATARRIAEDAGAIVLAGWRREQLDVKQKGAIDLVTEFDLASEAHIRKEMRAAFDALGHAVVAEEGSGADARDRELVWFCDPLDGTTNFAHGHFCFSVAIGLAQREADGRMAPLLGAVHAPALGMTWIGGPAVGAERIDRAGARPCRLGRAQTLSAALIASGFPYDRRTSPENNVAEHSRIVLQVQGIRRCGSAAMDLCLVADGSYDGYWEQKLAPWDMTAGAAIALGAGATLTGYEGEPIDVTKNRVIATNGAIHAELTREVSAARRAARLVL
jgi:myo-inositol-1(or 4)-monophosphatase